MQPGNFQKPSLSFVCPADWSKMKPSEQGRFCGSCQKTVVDFTQKSDAEILEMLSKRETEICGTFYSHQLTQSVNSNRFLFRRVLSSVLVLLGLSFLSKEAEAQQKSSAKKTSNKSVSSKIKKAHKEVVDSLGNEILTGVVLFDTSTKNEIELGDVVVETEIIAMDGPHPDADVLYHAEIMPEYKYGGTTGLLNFIKENLQYPYKRIDIEGYV